MASWQQQALNFARPGTFGGGLGNAYAAYLVLQLPRVDKRHFMSQDDL